MGGLRGAGDAPQVGGAAVLARSLHVRRLPLPRRYAHGAAGSRPCPGRAEVGHMSATAAPAIRARKGDGTPLVMVTAYDTPSARIADDAGVDIILVGDSVAMVVLGYDDTLSVTIDDMVHHTAAVARAKPKAMIVADMPWMSYHVSREETVRNAARLLRAGASAVKLEGGHTGLDIDGAILGADIPVIGHLGLTPQSVHMLGGFKV